QNIRKPNVTHFETLDGVNDSILFSDDAFFKEGEKYSVKIIYLNGKHWDTISPKTIITVNSKSSLTYVYEVKTGIPGYHSSCKITNKKNFSKDQKEIMLSYLQSQPRFYFGNEEVNNNLKNEITELLKLNEKQEKQINCDCWAWSVQ
ncbi:MAG TPA: hypothetical protein VGF30_10720, partial [Bacteroidia bacterium]